MELGKLESNEFRDHVNSSQTAIKDTSPILHGVQLAHHTDEELRNVEYRPGLTLEEYQALQNKKGSHAGHAHSSQTSHSTHSASPGIKNPQAEKSQNKRKFKILVNNYRLILRFLVFSYQLTHGLYLVMYIAPFFSNPFVKWMIQVTSISAVGTVIYNYIQTAQITSLSFKRKKSKSFLSNAEYKECDKCDNIWKPSRTHHCSVQAHDVLRMDHYCPVTLNTIGMRNHGAFFMTGVYHLICCLMWMILYFVYACYQFKPLIRSGILRAMLYILFGLTDYLIIASLAGLSVGIVASHIAFILNNRTTLEGYGETQALVTDLRKGNKGSRSWQLQSEHTLQSQTVLLGLVRPSAFPRRIRC